MNWQMNVTIGVTARRRGRMLHCGLSAADKGWIVIAVESPDTKAKSLLKQAKIVFDNHGHAIVGEFKSLAKAMLAAEAFTEKWKKGIAIDKCGCKEIGKK